MKKPIAILTSDWHLTEKCPKARTGDDWWEAMRYALEQVRSLQDALKVPVIIAGDTTDKNKHTHELQIFVMRNVPKGSVYVSFGQHEIGRAHV